MSEQGNTPETPKVSVKNMGANLFGSGAVPMPGMSGPQPSWKRTDATTPTAGGGPTISGGPSARGLGAGLNLQMLAPGQMPRPRPSGQQEQVDKDTTTLTKTPSESSNNSGATTPSGESGQFNHFKKANMSRHRRKPSTMMGFGEGMPEFTVDPVLTPTANPEAKTKFGPEDVSSSPSEGNLPSPTNGLIIPPSIDENKTDEATNENVVLTTTAENKTEEKTEDTTPLSPTPEEGDDAEKKAEDVTATAVVEEEKKEEEAAKTEEEATKTEKEKKADEVVVAAAEVVEEVKKEEEETKPQETTTEPPRLTIPPPTPVQIKTDIESPKNSAEEEKPAEEEAPKKKLPPGAVPMMGMGLPPQLPKLPAQGPPALNVDAANNNTSAQSLPPPMPANTASSAEDNNNTTIAVPPPTPPTFNKQMSVALPPLPTTPGNGPPPTPANANKSQQPPVFSKQATVTVNAQDSAVYRSLQQQVTKAKEANNKFTAQQQTQQDNLVAQIPTFFPEHAIAAQAPTRNNDQVFMCGPLGASQKKQWKPRWAVLFRDRLEIYNKPTDTKAWQVVKLDATLVQTEKDSEGVNILMKNEKTELYLKAIPASAENTPTNCINTTIDKPSVEVLHQAWLHALLVRVSALQFTTMCKERGMAIPDERLMTLYDAQYKYPQSMHTIAAYATAELYSKLPHLPGACIQQNGQDPVSKLPYEGIVVDLAGEPLPDWAISSLKSIFSQPDHPIFAVKFTGAPFDMKTTAGLLERLAQNTASHLVQLDLSGAKCLSMTDAKSREQCFEMLAEFLTSTHLTSLQRIVMKQSDLNDSFIAGLTNALLTTGKPIVAPLKVVDFSQNQLTDMGVNAVVSLLSAFPTVCNSLEYLNLSFNPFTDAGLAALSQWLTLPRPTAQSYVLQQQQNAPYKPINLHGLYLQGILSGDKGFIELSKALLYHIKLTTVDLTMCTKLHDQGIAAITHMLQINESIEIIKFANQKLTMQGLTALRLFYRYGQATQHPDLFGEQRFGLVGLAADYQ